MAETVKYTNQSVNLGPSITQGPVTDAMLNAGQVYKTQGRVTDEALKGGQAYNTALNNANNGIGPNDTTPNNNTTAPVTNSNNTPGTVTKNNDGSTTTVTTETTNGVTNTVTTTVPPAGAASNANIAGVSVTRNTDNIPEQKLPEVVVTATQPKEAILPTDWRVRLSLAPQANYLYKDPDIINGDILFPLKSTGGIIFPYLPTINVSYKANYNPVDITHTNYRNYFYQNSSVDDVTITAEFTAQDTVEAKYVLAVIHFFKSVTKMFYGQDSDPRGGTPPPLCYLTGLGAYQFNNHPLVISGFTYNLPNDVDYIRTESSVEFSSGGMPSAMKKSKPKGNVFSNFLSSYRLSGSNLNKGAKPSAPNFTSITTAGSGVSYVPTKISLTISAHPMITRKDISENFSLRDYATGDLTKRGIW
jgi:hypothetical protein